MPCDAALTYARRGWPVFSVGANKHPLTRHGVLDATTDIAVIWEWWCTRPDAIPTIATGERSGVVALDIDLRPGLSGFDSLEDLGVSLHPETPTSHTPRGGCHLLFAWPGHFVKTVAGKLGRGLDIRGDGGSLMLPPGPGRWWDPHLGPDLPLAPMPAWMILEPEHQVDASPRPILRQPLSRYGEAALDNAVNRIIAAPAGQQRDTLNREAYGIARLVAGGDIPSPLALEALCWAARQMRSHDPRRPWRHNDVKKAVQAAFIDGLARPRRPDRRGVPA
jgi:putative DNA primase/helicase